MVTPPAWAELAAVPDDTAQTDGRVSAIVVAGDRIYLGGAFTHVDGVPRGGLAAIDATTGRLTDWNPGTDGEVFALAMSADGSRLYVGGDFARVGTVERRRMAAVDPVTGAVERQWTAGTNRTVRALALRGNRLYLGGSFTTVKGLARERLAVVDADTGEPEANWTPAADSHVRTLELSPDGDRVYIGGDFSLVSGQSRQHLAALDAASGDVAAWRPDLNFVIHDLAVTDTRVYVGGEGVGGSAVAFDATSGDTLWSLRGDGDVQAVATRGDKVYLGGHFHELAGQTRERLAAVDAATGALDPRWTPVIPRSGQDDMGVWEIVGKTGRKLHIGGDFSRVSGEPQQGYARFTDSDVTPPTVAGVTPRDGATGVAPASDVVATFSEAMDASTLDGSTFTLRRQGASTPVASATSYDPATKKVTLDPSSDLARNATYTATLRGGTGGARDVVGNPLSADEVWTFETAPLEPPVITSPANNSYNNTGKITLSGTAEPGNTIEIFDGDTSEGTSVTSPTGIWSKELTGVSEGSHTYTARATDAAGDTSAPSNTRTVTVDLTPPGTTIASGPESTSGSNEARFGFTSTEANSKFECQLDSAAFAPCASPEVYTGLRDGNHTFSVRAVDAAGNTDATPADRAWTVDTTAPSLNITSGPNGGTYAPGSTQTWNFAVSDATSGVKRVLCKVEVNGAPSAFEPCSGAALHSVSDLPSGSHRFFVRATDLAGNVSPEQTRMFSIDSSPTDPSIGIQNVRVREKTRSALFNVRLSAASQQTLTVRYATVSGSAKARADYRPRSGTLTFAPGQTTQTIAVRIWNDRRNERTELFYVNLSRAINATIADKRGRGTIVDND